MKVCLQSLLDFGGVFFKGWLHYFIFSSVPFPLSSIPLHLLPLLLQNPTLYFKNYFIFPTYYLKCFRLPGNTGTSKRNNKAVKGHENHLGQKMKAKRYSEQKLTAI